MRKPRGTGRNWFRRILLEIAVWAAGFALLLAGGGWFYNAERQEQRRQVENQLASVARIKAAQLADWRNDQLLDASLLGRSPSFLGRVATFLEASEENARTELRDFLSLIQQQHDYENIVIVSPDAEVVLALGTPGAALGQELNIYLEEALDTGRPVFVDVHAETPAVASHVAVIAPLFLGDAQPSRCLGAVILLNDAQQFIYPLLASWPIVSETAETLFLRREGADVLFLGNTRFKPDAALRFRITGQEAVPLEVQSVHGRTGFSLGQDYRGQSVAAFLQPIDGTPWHIIAKMDLGEAFAEWRFRSMMMFILFVGFLTCAGFAVMLLWQRQQKTHYQALYQSEVALRASVERHSITLKAIGDAVISTDAAGRVELLNPVAESLTGWTEAEARGKPLQEVFHIITEEGRVGVEDPVSRVLREGCPFSLTDQTLLIDKQGRERPVADSAAPIVDMQGGNTIVTGAVLVFRDQTEERVSQRLTSARLAFAEYAAQCSLDALFANVLAEIGALSDSPLGVFIGVDDVHAGITFQRWWPAPAPGGQTDWDLRNMGLADAAATCILDKEPVVLNMPPAVSCVDGPPETVPRIHRALLTPILRAGKAVAAVAVFNKPGNYSMRDAETVSHLSHAAWDFVERKKIEAERERLLSAIEQAGEMIIVANAAGEIEYVNPAFERVTGFAATEVLGQKMSGLDAGAPDDASYRLLWDTVAAGQTWTGRRLNKRKDGTSYTEDVTVSPVRDSSGRIVNYVAVKGDVSLQLELERQYRQAQKMEAIGQLTGGVAHDFNNLLQVIGGFTDMAREELDPGHPAVDALAEVKKAYERAAHLVSQLLAFSRRKIMRPEDIEFTATIDEMIRMLRRVLPETIQLEWRPHPHALPLSADRGMIEQVLMNLCVNARDAMPHGGMLRIETDALDIGWEFCATHSWAKPGRFAVLSVEDTGCGMDKDTLDHIFEPFFTTKETGKGTGLGLAMVYGIMKQHEGMINAYSEPGKGTIFKLFWPLCEESIVRPETSEAPVPGVPVLSDTGTILLAEDNEMVRSLARKILERAGYRVISAENGVEAVALFTKHGGEAIDLVILDVVMPEMGGREAFERMRRKRPGVKVLFASGYSEDAIHTDFVLEKGLKYIQKPFTRETLLYAVRTILNEPQLSG